MQVLPVGLLLIVVAVERDVFPGPHVLEPLPLHLGSGDPQQDLPAGDRLLVYQNLQQERSQPKPPSLEPTTAVAREKPGETSFFRYFIIFNDLDKHREGEYSKKKQMFTLLIVIHVGVKVHKKRISRPENKTGHQHQLGDGLEFQEMLTTPKQE